MSAGGTLESFTIEGFKIYAIPDYVYRTDGIWHIHDWKAGRPRPEHADQLAVYGLWAHLAHGVDPAAVRLHAEYLSEGRTLSASYSVAEMERIKQRISDSVAAMCEYLEGGDPQCNRPIARELWDLAVDGSVCRWCNYYELCLPELRSVT